MAFDPPIPTPKSIDLNKPIKRRHFYVYEDVEDAVKNALKSNIQSDGHLLDFYAEIITNNKSSNNSVVEPPKKKMRAHIGLDCVDAPPIIGRSTGRTSGFVPAQIAAPELIPGIQPVAGPAIVAAPNVVVEPDDVVVQPQLGVPPPVAAQNDRPDGCRQAEQNLLDEIERLRAEVEAGRGEIARLRDDMDILKQNLAEGNTGASSSKRKKNQPKNSNSESD